MSTLLLNYPFVDFRKFFERFRTARGFVSRIKNSELQRFFLTLTHTAYSRRQTESYVRHPVPRSPPILEVLVEWRNPTPFFASTPGRRNKNIKYFISSSGIRTHKLSFLQLRSYDLICLYMYLNALIKNQYSPAVYWRRLTLNRWDK